MHKTHINISCVISVVTNGTQWKLDNTYKFSLSYLVDTTVQPAAHVDRCSRRLLAHIVIINLSSTRKFVNDIATWHDNVCVLCGYKFNNKHISNLLIKFHEIKMKSSKCPYCGYECTYKDLLHAHLGIHKRDSGDTRKGSILRPNVLDKLSFDEISRQHFIDTHVKHYRLSVSVKNGKEANSYWCNT